MPGYLFAFVLLEEVASILNYDLRLLFCAWDECAEEDVPFSRDRVFIGEHDQGRFLPLGEHLTRFSHLVCSWISRLNRYEQWKNHGTRCVGQAGEGVFIC